MKSLPLPVRHFRKWTLLLIVIGTFLFSWPSLVNKGPFFIADTSAYLRSADAAFSTNFDYTSVWSDKRHLYTKEEKQDPAGETSGASSAAKPTHPPLLGRSIYYGVFIYLPVLAAGEQAAVFLQSSVAAIVVWLCLVPLVKGDRRRIAIIYIGLCAALAALTSLPFTTSLVVPDYLTGVACASMIMLLCFWIEYSRLQRMLLIGFILLAALSHSSNLPLLLLIGIIAVLMKFCGSQLESRAILVGFLAVCIGLAGEAAFSLAVEQKTGIVPIRPPFLTARLIADGPGSKLLREKCPQIEFEVCRYSSRTPYDSDLFLWSTSARDGVFSSVDHASQRKLSIQDSQFALATLTTYPLLTMHSTLKAAVRQLTLFNYDIWRGSQNRIVSFENLPPPVAKRMAQTLNARGVMPVQPFTTIGSLVVIGSFFAAFFCVWKAFRSGDPRCRTLGWALLLVMLTLLGNALIAGGLSKPDARYNLRIIWILPLFLVLYLAARRSRPGSFSIGKD